MKSSHDVVLRTGRIKLPVGSLFWQEAGQGETIIFLHGSWHDSGQWLPVRQALATQYHCIAPDLIGFGESSRAATSHSIALEVEALHGLLTALRIDRCAFVGHSLGAWVALQYALRYPQQVQALALVEPEGLVAQNLPGRWRLERWLTAPFSPLPWLLSVGAPLLGRVGLKAQVKAWQRRRQILRQSPAACQILFRRRWVVIVAEMVDPRQLSPHCPTLFLTTPATAQVNGGFPHHQQQSLPPAATPLGLEAEATATCLRQFLSPASMAAVP